MKQPTRYLPTTALKIGDVVLVENGRFELTACYCSAETAAHRAHEIRMYAKRSLTNSDDDIEKDAIRQENVRGFTTKYLGPDDPSRECAIPAGWRSDDHPWAIQGNQNVSWTVEA